MAELDFMDPKYGFTEGFTPSGESVLYVYKSESDTLARLFSDPEFTDTRPNPVTAKPNGEFPTCYTIEDRLRLVVRDGQGNLRFERDAFEVSKDARNSTARFSFLDYAKLTEDRGLGYDSSNKNRQVAVGDLIHCLKEDIILEVLAPESTEVQTETAAGVKLSLVRSAYGIKVPEQLGLRQAIVEDATSSCGGLSGVSAPANINAAWRFRHMGPIVLPSGDFSMQDVLDMGADRDKLTLRGQGQFATRIRIPDGQYLYESGRNPISIDFSGIHFVGGKGVVNLKNETEFTRGYYKIHECGFSDFTEAALFSASPDFGRWDIRGNFFWARGSDSSDITGIGIALAGWGDNSLIELNRFHKVRYGFKLGRGATVAWFQHNSFLRSPGMDAGAMTPIWLVPNAAGQQSIGGLHISENRFGNEHLQPDDFHIIVADEDVSSGSSFAARRHSTAEASGRLSGAIFEKNWASGSSNQALVHSYTGRLDGCRFSNQLRSGMAGEVAFDAVATPDHEWVYQGANLISSENEGMDRERLHVSLGDFAFLFRVEDPHETYASDAVNGLQAAGTDPELVSYITPSSASASVGAPTVVAVADSLGGSAARNVTFQGDDSSYLGVHRLFWSDGLVIDAANRNRLHWIEIEVAAGLADSLTQIGLSIREGTSLRLRKTARVPDAGWTTVRLSWIPGKAGPFTFSVHPKGWLAGTNTQVRLGRVRVYAAHAPVNQGHALVPGGAWDGAHLILGGYHIWVDDTGALRGKNGAPGAVDDGAVFATA